MASKNTMGAPILTNCTVNENCSSLKPLANNFTSTGAIPHVSSASNIPSKPIIFIILLVWEILPSLPSFASTSDNIGIKVVVIALLISFVKTDVAVNAMTKASVFIPDPNLYAIRVSLTKPSSLLPRVNIIIITADIAAVFFLLDFFIINLLLSFIIQYLIIILQKS